MARPPHTGPERETLFERFVGLLHLPYAGGSFLLALLLGPPAVVLVEYVTKSSLDNVVMVLTGSESVSVLQTVSSEALIVLANFAVFYGVRDMRLRLLRTEAEIVSLCPRGEEDFHKAFRRVSLSRPPLVIAAVFALLIVLPTVLAEPPIPEARRITGILRIVTFLGVATFIWVYASSLRGLHELGKGMLRLKPFYEDGMLGSRPLGSFSLRLAFSYLNPLGLVLLATSIVPDPSTTVLLSILTAVGVVMFFLPLNSIHQAMLESKRKEQASIRAQLRQVMQRSSIMDKEASDATLKDLEIRLSDLAELQALDMAQREVASIHTWPFDTQILGKLTVIILSVTAAVIARLIILAANL